MTRLLALTIVTVLVVAVCHLHRHPSVSHHPVVGTVQSATTVLPARAVMPLSTVPKSHRGSRPRPACTDRHFKQTLGVDEKWIDLHESRLRPTDREPTTGAYGLGQLLPATYRLLGLTPSPSPCAQIEAQRAYAHERYGSFRNARTFWEANRWW